MGCAVDAGAIPFDPNWLEQQSTFERVVDARACGDLPAYFAGIRSLYRQQQCRIDAGEYEPLFVDWKRLFTPIEHEAWTELRACRLTMFPQFPALKFFLDFADPWRKLAIECDGAPWHDGKRDHERDRALYRAEGWTVFRFTGRELWKDRINDDGEEDPPTCCITGVTMKEIYEIWGSKCPNP